MAVSIHIELRKGELMRPNIGLPILLVFFLFSTAFCRKIPVDVPAEYYNWQNDKFYLHNVSNPDAKWNGKPVVVFVHGIRSNTALCWGISPDVNVTAITKWKDILKTLFVEASVSKAYCTNASDGNIVKNWINHPDPWKESGIHYRALCSQCPNDPAYCSKAQTYLLDILKACCKLQAIHGKRPGPFFVHDNRTTKTVYEYVEVDGSATMDLPTKASTPMFTVIVGGPKKKYVFNREKQVPTGSVYNDNNPNGAVNASKGILSWVAQNYGRTDPTNYLNGIEFIDFFNPRSTMDEWMETPLNVRVRYLDSWQFDTPYGWNGQIILQTIEILEKYWPGGAWKNNPNAKIIFVCHSAGGVAVRTMIKTLSDESWKSEFLKDLSTSGSVYDGYYKKIIHDSDNGSDIIDVRHNIGKIITFASPHAGGDGSWVNGFSNYLGDVDKKDPISLSSDPLSLTVKSLYDAVNGIAGVLEITFGDKCDSDLQEFRALDIFQDLRDNSYYIQRINDNFPLDPNNNPIPTVCFTFEGDGWGANGLLSRALSSQTLNKYQSYLKEFTISTFSGQDDVHGKSVKEYWDPTNFKAAFDFCGISPDTDPPASTIKRSRTSIKILNK
jgi:hypothetical protein